MANDTSIQVLLDALGTGLGKPVIASPVAKAKRVTGEFDISRPRALLRRLSQTLSLIWYDDGTSIYIYDSAETQNGVVSMDHATLDVLRDFVRETRLDDDRYPIRGDDLSKTFYVSGPPVYVDLVTAAAKYLDQMRGSEQSGRMVVKLVQLQHSFVNDRRYMMRDQPVLIPGIATVLNQIYGDARGTSGRAVPSSSGNGGFSADPFASRGLPSPSSGLAVKATSTSAGSPFSLLGPLPAVRDGQAAANSIGEGDGLPVERLNAPPGMRAVAYPDTNSVVLSGTLDAVQEMERLIHALDVAKRQVELSLWIIDIKKGSLDKLGIVWQAEASRGSLGVGFNGGAPLSTQNGQHFLASIQAMSLAGDARVVSRPILLTQENAPAIFDNNQTFYTQTVGERTAQLDHVTYGTLVSVLPRLTDPADHVEMQVDVEDGNSNGATVTGGASSNGLPLVNRMEIHTVARVPVGKSLLIGGNTMDNVTRTNHKIPLLGDIPLLGALFRGHSETHDQVVRVYLIEPRLLPSGASWQRGQGWVSGDPERNATLRATVKLLQPFIASEK
nr:type III secretion system outer membrane ring subunit SctC [Burkholderia ubonensis]